VFPFFPIWLVKAGLDGHIVLMRIPPFSIDKFAHVGNGLHKTLGGFVNMLGL